MENLHNETKAIHTGVYSDEQYNSVSTPIYQTSTFSSSDLSDSPDFTYSRFNNPTRTALQENINALEGGAGAVATNSGTSAILLPLMMLKAGDHVICGTEVHGGTHVMIKKFLSKFNIEHTFVDLRDLEATKSSVKPNTQLIWIETPTNPLLSIIDIKAVVEIAHYAEALTVVDNTLMTPLWQQPFDFGADIIVHSTTKYINGHSDVIGGAVVARTEDLFKELQSLNSMLGVGAAPFDAWLTLRGVKTLGHRLRAHEANAAHIANFLQAHPLVKKTYYPGLASHPGHELAKRQQKSFGGLVCADLDLDQVDLQAFFDSLKLFNIAYSLGGVESIISHPWSKSHSCMSEAARKAAGVSRETIRISAGIEYWEDLVNDLQNALKLSILSGRQHLVREKS